MILAILLSASAWANPSDYVLATSVAHVAAYHQTRRWEVLGAYAGNFVLTETVKRVAKRERPDGSDNRSFFSGHTSTAFVGAGAVCLRESMPPCIISLGLAGAVGVLRVTEKKHWPTDVIVGAGVGFASGRFIPKLIVGF